MLMSLMLLLPPKKEAHIKKASNDLIDSAEKRKFLLPLKYFLLMISRNILSQRIMFIKSYLLLIMKLKKTPMDNKALIDLKRSIVSIKRQGTHTDTYLAASDAVNNELYGYKKGREDIGKTVSLADSAIGDIKYIETLDMKDPKR